MSDKINKRKAREWWVSVDKDGVLWGEALGSKKDKKDEMVLLNLYDVPTTKIIKVREVLK